MEFRKNLYSPSRRLKKLLGLGLTIAQMLPKKRSKRKSKPGSSSIAMRGSSTRNIKTICCHRSSLNNISFEEVDLTWMRALGMTCDKIHMDGSVSNTTRQRSRWVTDFLIVSSDWPGDEGI